MARGKKGYVRDAEYNKAMARPDGDEVSCEARCMTPSQADVYIVIDEFWKKFGCGPTYREIALVMGKKGIGNIKRIVDRLVESGACKKIPNRDRSVRPSYMTFKKMYDDV